MAERYRLIDTAVSELDIVTIDRSEIREGDTGRVPRRRRGDGRRVYDDEEHGQEGGVRATLVIDDE